MERNKFWIMIHFILIYASNRSQTNCVLERTYSLSAFLRITVVKQIRKLVEWSVLKIESESKTKILGNGRQRWHSTSARCREELWTRVSIYRN